MIRRGILFDRTPGRSSQSTSSCRSAAKNIGPLWPWGKPGARNWRSFHNPQATHPIPFDLIPGATHWFERDGDIECSTIWANSVLASITHLHLPGEPEKAGNTSSQDEPR